MFIAKDIGGRSIEPMRINSMKKIGGSILGLLLFLGIMVMSSTTAQAQYPWYQDRDQQRRQQEYERQRQRELQRQREQQARQGGWYDQYGNYHPATNNQSGWYDQYGNYHPSNQSGTYNNGYYNQNGNYGRSRSYDNYPNYGGSYNFRQTALNAGYNAGIRAGRDDRRRGRYDPYSHSEYRNAMKDYNSREGDRGTYAQYFRQAFETGYRDGYNGY